MDRTTKRTEVPRFRSQWNYGPDCPSTTVYGPSEVDSSQYEEVSTLVLKLLRGELRSNVNPVYDVDSDANPETAISEMPVTRSDGFDLSDAASIVKEGEEALRSIQKAKEKSVKDESKASESNPADASPTDKQARSEAPVAPLPSPTKGGA